MQLNYSLYTFAVWDATEVRSNFLYIYTLYQRSKFESSTSTVNTWACVRVFRLPQKDHACSHSPNQSPVHPICSCEGIKTIHNNIYTRAQTSNTYYPLAFIKIGKRKLSPDLCSRSLNFQAIHKFYSRIECSFILTFNLLMYSAKGLITTINPLMPSANYQPSHA